MTLPGDPAQIVAELALDDGGRGVRGVGLARGDARLRHLLRDIEPDALERHPDLARRAPRPRRARPRGRTRRRARRCARPAARARHGPGRRHRPWPRPPACSCRPACASSSATPAWRLRSTSLRTTTAPGARPISGAQLQRQGGLAAARQAADRQQARRRRLQEAKRDLLVGARRLRCALPLTAAPAHRRRRGSRRGATGTSAAAPAPPRASASGSSAMRHSHSFSSRLASGTQPALAQVHQREGEIVEHVDVGDSLRELDGVERHRLARRSARCCAGADRHGSAAPRRPRRGAPPGR